MSTFFPCDDPDFVLPSIENPALFRHHKHRHHRPQCSIYQRSHKQQKHHQHQQGRHHVNQQRVHNAAALGCNRADSQNALASEPRNICRSSGSFFDSNLDRDNDHSSENLYSDPQNNNHHCTFYSTPQTTVDFSDVESDCCHTDSRSCDCDFSCGSSTSSDDDDDDDDEIPARVRPPLRTETSKSGNRLRTIPYASAAAPQTQTQTLHPHLDHLRRRQLQSLYARSRLDNHCLPLQLAPQRPATEKCCLLPTTIPTPPVSLHSADSTMRRGLRSSVEQARTPVSPTKKRLYSGDTEDIAEKRSRLASRMAAVGTPTRRRGRPPKVKPAEVPAAQVESASEDPRDASQSVPPRDIPSARSKLSKSSLVAEALDRDTSMNLSQTTGLDHGTPPRQARVPPKTTTAIPAPDYVYPQESLSSIPLGVFPTSPAESSLFMESSVQIYGMNIPEIMTLGELAGMENMNHASEPFQLPYDRNSWPLWRYLAYLRRKFEKIPSIDDVDLLERFFREQGEALQKAYSGVDENIDILLSLREEGDCYDAIPEAIANDLALVVIPFGIMLLQTLFAASRIDDADSDAGVFRFTQLTIYPVACTVKWLQTLEQAVTDFRTRGNVQTLQARQRALARAHVVESEEEDDDDDGFEPVKGFDPKRDQPRPMQSVLGHGLHIMADKVNSLYEKLMSEN